MNEGPGIPKGSGNVRMLAYLASIENDQSSERAEYVGCVACVLTWRVFYSVFSQGAWSYLNRNIEKKGTPPHFPCRGRRGPWNKVLVRKKGEREVWERTTIVNPRNGI